MCEMICCVVPRRKMNLSCLARILLHHDCLSLTWLKATVPTVVSCPGLPPTQGAWWEITCRWYCRPLNTVWNPRDLMTVRLAGTLPTEISTSASCITVWYFYTSLTRQNYNLSFEGDSEWLRIFISPRAPPALRSLIRCFICPAHSDKVNYSSAFSSFTVSNCESITHWVDELVKQHARGINRPEQTVHLASHKRVFWVQTCPAASLAKKQSRMSRHKSFASIKLVFNGSQTGLKQKRWQRREPVWKNSLKWQIKHKCWTKTVMDVERTMSNVAPTALIWPKSIVPSFARRWQHDANGSIMMSWQKENQLAFLFSPPVSASVSWSGPIGNESKWSAWLLLHSPVATEETGI